MDRLISEFKVIRAIEKYVDNIFTKSMGDLIKDIKAIPSVESQDSEDKIIRRTLENFMRGLWEEIQVGELEYTTSEVYEMLEREIFTDNHVAIPSVEPYKGMTNGEVIKAVFPDIPRTLEWHIQNVTDDDWWNSPYDSQESEG